MDGLLTAAKQVLRITGNDFDTEIDDLISAARIDLKESGVDSTLAASTSDALIKRAVFTYVKANFGWNNPDAERLKLSYDTQAKKLSLTTTYRQAEAV